MKTIRVGNDSNRTLWTLALIAGLGGLYFYQRRGGKISHLISTGVSQLATAREKIGQIAPSVANKSVSGQASTTQASV